MAYSSIKAPNTHQPGIILVPNTFNDAGNTGLATTTAYIAFKLADLAGLTEAEAHHSTGDWRYIVRGVVEALYDDYDAMATADKPDNMTVTESSLISTTTAGESNRTWTVTATLNTGALEVADE